jgi:hypothetical protein
MEMLADYIGKIITLQKYDYKFTPSLVLKSYILYDTLILSEDDQYAASTRNTRTSFARNAHLAIFALIIRIDLRPEDYAHRQNRKATKKDQKHDYQQRI